MCAVQNSLHILFQASLLHFAEQAEYKEWLIFHVRSNVVHCYTFDSYIYSSMATCNHEFNMPRLKHVLRFNIVMKLFNEHVDWRWILS